MRLSERDVNRFTLADCHVLARRIHRVTGWQLCAFPWDGKPDDHVFVRVPDGRYLDVLGLWPEADFQAEWNEDEIGDFTLDDVLDHWVRGPGALGGCHWNNYSWARARQVADFLIDLTNNAGPGRVPSITIPETKELSTSP